jgi:hypothetical protein
MEVREEEEKTEADLRESGVKVNPRIVTDCDRHRGSWKG